MKRLLVACAALTTAAVLAPGLRADVKTTEKTTFKLEGLMGAMLNRMAGGSNGITSTIALKGDRMARMDTSSGQGQIIDLAEQKVYTVDQKKKEYTVMTFAEMRAQLEKAKEDLAKSRPQMSPEDQQAMQDASKQFEFDVNVNETGQRKASAGQDAREVVLTLTMRQAGRTLEEGGGMVMTNTMWLAPRVAALDELADFNMKFFKAVYGGVFSGMDMQQMNSITALFPALGSLMEQMAAEGKKLDGTALSTTSVIETVKSAEQLAAAQPSGGIGGMLARRMMRGNQEPRTKTLTTTHDTLSIGTTVAAEDVAIPANFNLKN